MNDVDLERRPWHERPLLRRAEQITSGAIIGASLVAIVGFWCYKAGPRGGIIEIDRGDPSTFQFQVDLNSATWPELTLLPEVGETIARRIIAYRDQFGPFTNHQQLLNVSGIGPKTFQRIQPFLRPLPAPPIAHQADD